MLRADNGSKNLTIIVAIPFGQDNADRTIDWLLNTDPVKQAERFELKLKQKKLEESKGVESLLDGPKSAGAVIAHSLGFHGGRVLEPQIISCL